MATIGIYAILFMVDLEEKLLEIFEKKKQWCGGGTWITYFSFGNMVKNH